MVEKNALKALPIRCKTRFLRATLAVLTVPSAHEFKSHWRVIREPLRILAKRTLVSDNLSYLSLRQVAERSDNDDCLCICMKIVIVAVFDYDN